MKKRKIMIPGMLLTFLTAIFLGCGGANTSQNKEDTTSQLSNNIETNIEEVQTAEPMKEDEDIEETQPEEPINESDTKESIVIDSHSLGEYGKTKVINAGTEFEETLTLFYIPNGEYEVTNDTKYFNQINVYTDSTKITEDGWEEIVVGEEGGSYTIKPGETITISVPEGYVVDIFDSKFTLIKLN